MNEDAEVLTLSRDLPNTENVVVAAGLLEASGGAGATGLEYRDFTGTPVVGAYAPLPSLGWGVGVEVPADEALAEISQMRWGIVGASAAFLILVVVAAWVITRRVTRPLRTLAEGARVVGSGNLDHTIPVESNDELGELARSFNQMGTDLRNAVKTQLAERQEAEEQLRGARDAALEASRTKSEFLASMSHEIRTPMNAIIGMTDLLSETPINADQAEYLRVISSAGDTLMTLINDILDLSEE